MKKALLVLILIFLTSTCVFAVDYSKYSLSDINSIRKATEAYQLEFKDKKGTKEAQTEYLRFLEFYYRAVDRQSELIKIEIPDSDKLYRHSYYWQARKYTNQYFDKGLRIDFNGEYYITTNNEYIHKSFCPYLGADWCELLNYRSKLDKKILIWDCRYVVPRSEIVEILGFYKRFLRKYPNFISAKDIKYVINSYEQDLKHYPHLDY